MTAAGASAFTRLVGDFADQVASLADVADGCDPAALVLQTPAAGWTVADSLAHLATFDENAVVAITEPDRFRADLADALRSGRDLISRGDPAGPDGRTGGHTPVVARRAATTSRRRSPVWSPGNGSRGTAPTWERCRSSPRD